MAASLLSAPESFVAVIDAQPGFYRERPDVDPDIFSTFIDSVVWVTHLARALQVPTILTAERPDRNGPPADAVIAAAGTQTVYEKHTFDLAAQADIHAAVAALGRQTAVLVGMETDVCVAHSAIGLAAHGHRVAVVVDATFSPGPAHQHGLRRLDQFGVELLSAKQLFYEWLPTLQAVRTTKSAAPHLRQPPGFHL
ncbi:MAG TPA: isochorismatase family protein [Acidimicrobiales bacterium]|nr:isochorismatase family protein [Acidimicrobiales bacterium]